MKRDESIQYSRPSAAISRGEAGFALVVVLGLAVIAWPIWRWAIPALVGSLIPVLALAALLTLPGLALLRLLWPAPLPLDERLALALSLSAALPPLLLLAASLVALRWNGPLAWAALAICVPLAFWRRHPPDATPTEGRQAMLALLLITAGSLAVRLYATRELVMGAFGDSVHHTIIAQLLVDHGGLFRSWAPYAQLTTFTYHYGFHSLAAWLHWLSGVAVTQGVLVVGQTMAALAAPTLYLLTLRLSGSRPAALWAALVAGLLSAMPGFYASWGRYTQLAGQAVLIGVCVIWAAMLDESTNPAPSRAALVRYGGLAGISTAGLVVIHYRVAVFAACFVLAYTLYLLLARVRSGRSLGLLGAAGLAAGGLAILIALPWLLRIREGKLIQIGNTFIAQNIGTEGTNGIPTPIIEMAAPWPLAGLATAAIGVLIWQRRWRGLVLPLWAVLVGLAANPYLIGLSGAGVLTNFAMLIAGYLLIAPLAGVALGALGSWAWQLPWGRYLVSGAGLLLAAWGLSWQPGNIDRSNELFRPADVAAMTWISDHTPPDARLFVNSFLAYGGSLYAGSDGGWMITFFTGRSTNLPPITYGSEAGAGPDYWASVNAENAAVLGHAIDTPAAAAALKAAGFSYLYNGPAASPGDEYLDPERVNASPLYEQVYDRDGATVWRIR